jgi:putative phage-type endonuclease
MLNIHFNGPLSTTRHAQYATTNTLSCLNSNKTSNALRRSHTTYASGSSQQHQGRHEGNTPNSHHEQKKIATQKQAYNTISERWNVPRTSLHHFPPETQRHIRENKRGESKSTPNGGNISNTTSLPSSPLQASITKTLQVLAYESKAGYNNFQGKSGEYFTEWMANTLRVLSSDLSKEPGRGGSLAQQCDVLSARYIAGYEGMLGGSKERQAAVNEMTVVLTALSKELQKQPEQPITSISDSTTNNDIATTDIDAEAAEAHAEETATATTTTTAATSTAAAFTSSSTNSATKESAADVEKTNSVTDLGDGYVMMNNRRVKASTVAFRESFAQAAAIQQAVSSSAHLNDFSNGEQRTSQWLSLRERRLTASAFSKALGFFPGDRISLWEEKIGLSAPFAGNDATSWGTRMEPEALQQYEALTGQRVESCMFRVKHDDPPHGWLGASPDGLVQGLEIIHSNSTTNSTNSTTTAGDGLNVNTGGNNGLNSPSSSKSSLGQGPGILEIKCPYNKGRPELAVPPQRAIWYYMPQLQGLMDIFDRQWCSLYVWTQAHGSASFQVKRNEEYWAAAFEILAEFWWGHVVPARQAKDAGCSREEIEAYRPVDQIEAAEKLRRWSKNLAAEAPGTFYSGGGGGGRRAAPARRW